MTYSFRKEWDQVDMTGWPPSAFGFYEKMRETLIMMQTPQAPQTLTQSQDPDVQMSDDAVAPTPKAAKANAAASAPQNAKNNATRSKLMSRIATASLHAPATTLTSNTSGLISPTFTPAPFPVIHASHPTAPLDHVDPNQLTEC